MINKLNKILHEHDPMGTCCAVNEDMDDEYLTEATEIVGLIDTGYSFDDAYCVTMTKWFSTSFDHTTPSIIKIQYETK